MTITFVKSQPDHVAADAVAVRLYSGEWIVLNNVQDGSLSELLKSVPPSIVRWERPEDRATA